jgi:hypothetical protein
MKLGHNKRSTIEEDQETDTPPIREFKAWQLGVGLFVAGNLANFGSFAFAVSNISIITDMSGPYTVRRPSDVGCTTLSRSLGEAACRLKVYLRPWVLCNLLLMWFLGVSY